MEWETDETGKTTYKMPKGEWFNYLLTAFIAGVAVSACVFIIIQIYNLNYATKEGALTCFPTDQLPKDAILASRSDIATICPMAFGDKVMKVVASNNLTYEQIVINKSFR